MNLLDEADITVNPQLKSSRSILIMLGILQIIFGFIALSTPWTASVAISEVISILFVITGVVQFFQVLHSHFGSKVKYADRSILIAILYVARWRISPVQSGKSRSHYHLSYRLVLRNQGSNPSH